MTENDKNLTGIELENAETNAAAEGSAPYIDEDTERAQQERIETELQLERWRLRQETEEKAVAERRKLLARRIIISSSLLLTGSVLSTGSLFGLQRFFLDHWTLIAGVALTLAGTLYALFPSIASPMRLSDVDTRRSLSPAAAWPFPTGSRPDDDESDAEESNRFLLRHTRRSDPFTIYFHELKDTLQEKANDADEKASILLDRGASYTKWGIYFFVFSIFVWQALSWIHGFQSVYIYGIASCSALFIFIEFLSAWFLRQYRHYVDTSTYLLKVKAIFDRFMLIYLANDSMLSPATDDQERRARMLVELLGQEIKWPETYLLKHQDVSFAKEAMEAVVSLTKELRKKDTDKDADKKK